MAVPSSGPLELRGDINLEVNGNVTDTNVALRSLSQDAGFSSPDAMSDFYGYANVTQPTVQTNGLSRSAVNSTTACGCVTDSGNQPVSAGFYHGRSGYVYSNTKYTRCTSFGGGCFTQGFGSLAYNATYYAWAWATNDAGTVIGNRCQATTSSPPFSVTSAPITQMRARGWGETSQYNAVGWVNPYTGGFNTVSGGSSVQYDGSTAATNAPNRIISEAYMSEVFHQVDTNVNAVRQSPRCLNSRSINFNGTYSRVYCNDACVIGGCSQSYGGFPGTTCSKSNVGFSYS